jgi:Fe-S-cluster containining protein
MSSLFKNFEPDLVPGGERRLPLEILGDYAEAKREFVELLDGAEKIELLKKTFQIMEVLEAQAIKNIPIKCRAKCAACCLQGVSCTKLEMNLIKEFLSSKKRERRLVRRKAAEKAAKYREIIEAAGIYRYSRHAEEADKKLYSLLELKPCPFLGGGQTGLCGIYPVRPIVCRFTRTADNRCGTRVAATSKPKIKAAKFFFDQIAADIVAEESRRIFGELGVPPITVWIESEYFGSFFDK